MLPSGSLLFSPATPSLQGKADAIAALLQQLENRQRVLIAAGRHNTPKAEKIREKIRANKDQLREVLRLIQEQKDAARIQRGHTFQPLGFISTHQPNYSVTVLPAQGLHSPRRLLQALRTLEGHEFMLIRNGQGASEDMHRVRSELAQYRAVLAQMRGHSQSQANKAPEITTEEETGLPARPAKRQRGRS